MAIYLSVRPDYHETVIEVLKEMIDNKEILTWSYTSNGNFTHKTNDGQWNNLAFFKPYCNVDKNLIFGLLKNKNKDMTHEIYSIYHGRFIEMLLQHFEDYFSVVSATSEKNPDYDKC